MQVEAEQPDSISRPLAINSKPRAILTSEKAVEIFSRSLPSTGSSSAEKPHATSVAREYGISEKTVRDIWTGRTWSNETLHLDPQRPAREAKPTGRPRGKKDTAPRKRKLKNCEDSVSMQSLEAGTWLAYDDFDSLSRGNSSVIIQRAQEVRTVRSASRSGFSADDEGNYRKYSAISVIDNRDCQRNLPYRPSSSPNCTLNTGPSPLFAGKQPTATIDDEHWPQGCHEAVDFDLSCVSSETGMRGSWDSGTGALAGCTSAEVTRILSGQLGSFAVWKLDGEDDGSNRAGLGCDRPKHRQRGEDTVNQIRVSDGSGPDCGPLVPTGWNPDVLRAVGKPAWAPGAPSAAHGPPGARNEQLGLPCPAERSRIAAAADVEESTGAWLDPTIRQWTAASDDGCPGIWAGGDGGGGCGSGHGSDGCAVGGNRVTAVGNARNRVGGRALGGRAGWGGDDSDDLGWSGPACGRGWGGASMDPLSACDSEAAAAGAGCGGGGGGCWADYSRPPDSGPTAGGRSFAQPPAAASSAHRRPDTSSAAAGIGAGRVDAVGSLCPFEPEPGCWGPALPPQPPKSTATWAYVAEEQLGGTGVDGHQFWGRRQEQHSRQGCHQYFKQAQHADGQRCRQKPQPEQEQHTRKGCRQHSEQTQDADGQKCKQHPWPEQQPHQQREQQRRPLQMQPLQLQPHEQQRPRWHPQQDPLQQLYELPQSQPQQQQQQHLHQQQQYQHQYHLQLLPMQPLQETRQTQPESEQLFKQQQHGHEQQHQQLQQQQLQPQHQQQRQQQQR